MYLAFLRLFCRMRNRSYVSEREFTRLVDRSVTPSFLPWVVNFCLYFRWPMHNLTWRREKCRRMVSANVKHSEAMSDEKITAMSTACGASSFLIWIVLNWNLESNCCPSYEMPFRMPRSQRSESVILRGLHVVKGQKKEIYFCKAKIFSSFLLILMHVLLILIIVPFLS